MDFDIRLPVSTNWKGKTYDSILIIVDLLTNIINFELVNVIINTAHLAQIIINILVWHYGLPDSIVSDRGLVFTLKFWSSLWWFLGI